MIHLGMTIHYPLVWCSPGPPWWHLSQTACASCRQDWCVARCCQAHLGPSGRRPCRLWQDPTASGWCQRKAWANCPNSQKVSVSVGVHLLWSIESVSQKTRSQENPQSSMRTYNLSIYVIMTSATASSTTMYHSVFCCTFNGQLLRSFDFKYLRYNTWIIKALGEGLVEPRAR